MTTFDKDRALNSVLYIINGYGGTSDMHKIFKTLYFADRMHLSFYGRSITSDDYIAMKYGPVPSMTDDIFKAVRGDSFFSDRAEDVKGYFHFINNYIVRGDKSPDMDYLSESDIECLDQAIELCRDKSFPELTNMSHALAWNNTPPDHRISVKDILREACDTEEYAEYVAMMLKSEKHAF